MRRIFYLIVGVAVGGAAMWGAFNYHFLRTAEGVTYVPKQSANLSDVYLDVRDWSLADWKQHPAVVQALVANGRTELVANADTLNSTLNDWLKR
jgi:hypothetical protein